MNENQTYKKWISWFLFAVAIIVTYNIFGNFKDISTWINNLIGLIMPFLMGILVAYLFYIPCRSIESMFNKNKNKFLVKRARKLSIICVYLIALLILVIIINFIIPAISKSFIELVNNLPSYYNRAIEFIEQQPEDSWLGKINIEDTIRALEQIDFSRLFSIENVISYIKGALGIVNVFFSIFVTIVISIYILAERKEIIQFLSNLASSLFKKRTCKYLSKYFRESNEIFFRFISSQILDGIIIGIILTIAMSIMDVKYAVLLGFMIGLFNIIPYFGAIIATFIAIIITIFTGGLTQAIWTLIVVVILQQIDANIINPRIVGNSLKLSPILVIFSVTIGGAYFGILGMFLAVPVVAVIKLLLIDFIEYRQKNKNRRLNMQ